MGQKVEPKVTLVGCTGWDSLTTGGTTTPLKLIACQLLNMQGKMHHNINEISEEQAVMLVRDLKKTALAGGLEVLDMVFQIENVPRALTHQMVRTRVGATYHQESLRFTTREDGFDFDIGNTISKSNDLNETFISAMANAAEAYEELVKHGASTEDARGVLPIALMTKIGVKYNFKTLVHCANVRLCYQSQGHWRKVFNDIKSEIETKIHPVLGEFLVPICDITGRCEYKGIFDRKCPKEQKMIMDTCSACFYYDNCQEAGRLCQAIKSMHRL